MLFSEDNAEWREFPRWVKFLIQIGYGWPNNSEQQRRICLVSMPCDSAAAGLIVLGAVIRDLCDPDANEVAGHYDGLLRYARQYLHSCRHCELAECNPDIKRCGYVAKALGKVRSTESPKKIATISDKTDFNKKEIWFEHLPKAAIKAKAGKVNIYTPPKYAVNWYVDGHSPVQVSINNGALSVDYYQRLVENALIVPDNLRRSFSGLCLAGRSNGEAATRKIYSSIQFRDAANAISLSDLIAVQGWANPHSITRVAYFNPLIQKLVPTGAEPALVVSDGDLPFLKVLGRREFQTSNIIGVIQRTIERARLEDVGTKISGLRQWYTEDSDMLDQLPPAPPGISVLILKQRIS